jgi:hypothetical protein
MADNIENRKENALDDSSKNGQATDEILMLRMSA